MAAVKRWLFALFACTIAFTAIPARADDDLPGRVGRVANVQGPLYRAPEDSAGDWAEIGLNDPVAQGDNLWVDHDGRAEIDYGGGQFRLAGDTNLHVSRLDDRQLGLFVAAGRLIVRVRVLDPDESVRVDTPASQIALARPGLYRIDVAADSPQTTVIVREGEAQIASSSGTAQVFPGQTASVSGVDNEQADIGNGGGIDGFDAWSAVRDRVYEQPRQNAYVSRQMVGQADLDPYGSWQTYPDYGAVWFPTVVAIDWAPYRYGHWTWLPGWGYTWVDDAPWGYAPFHYGRWAYISGRWGWCPGAYVARPLWAPALVAWYGGSGWNQSRYGGPVYGWVPLGWREPFAPSWRCTSRCWTRYNRPYAVSADSRRDAPPTHYVNWTAPGGVTAVAGAALANGRPVAINRVPVGSGVGAGVAPTVLATPPAIKPNATPPAGSVVSVPDRALDRSRITPVAPPERPNRPVPAATVNPAERSFRPAPSPPTMAAPPAMRAPAPQMPSPAPAALQRPAGPAPAPIPGPQSRPAITPVPATPAGEIPRPAPPRPPERPS